MRMTGKVKNKNKKKSQAAAVWRRLKKNKMAVLGLIILAVIIFFAGIFAAYYIAKLPRLIKGVLDVVLTEKSLLCESRGIQLNAVANGSCLGFFEAGDLYALFANALDHAVESAVQVSRPECRVIDLLVCVRQGFVVVNIISPLRPPEQQASRSAQYELKVIRRIVQKYKGTLTLEEQGEFFAEKIIFPLQK